MNDFDSIIEGLFEEGEVIGEETDLSTLSNLMLIEKLATIDNMLLAEGKLLIEGSQKHRDLHSERGAIIIILKERKVL